MAQFQNSLSKQYFGSKEWDDYGSSIYLEYV